MPPHVESIRSEVQELLRAVPFRPFALLLKNGQRVLVEHPENIAFALDSSQSKRLWGEFTVYSGGLRLVGTFEKVTTVAVGDQEGLAG